MKPHLAPQTILVFLLVALFSPRVAGLDSSRKISQYGHNMWRIQDGHLPAPPDAIAQTADGYLWVGTPAGLVRFDGVRFVPWASPKGEKLPSDQILSLLGASDAMWTYLNIPFLLARPGVESEQVEPWQESGETWRRLKVRFPADIATHSTEQTLYFDRQGLLRRQDYNVEIDGTAGAAHYVYDHKEFSGIVFPTKRRVFRRQPDGHPAPEPLIISIDINRIVLS